MPSSTLVDSFDALTTALKAEMIGRDTEIDVLALAILSRHNVFEVSDPGTGKTLLFDRLCARIADANTFGITFSRHTVVDDLLGPQSIPGLTQGQYIRLVDGFAPTAHLCLFDELPRASEATANATLELINERRYNQNGQKVRANVHTVVAAANSMLQAEHDGLGACADRFLFQIMIAPLSSRDDMLALWDVAIDDNPAACITWDQVMAAHAETLDVKIPDDVFEAAFDLKRKAEQLGVTISNRRWRECRRVIQAQAWLNGRDTAELADLEPLMYVFWQQPEQFPHVEAEVARIAAPNLAAALQWSDDVAGLDDEIRAMLGNPSADRTVEAPRLVSKVKSAAKELTALADTTGGRSKQLVAGALNRLQSLWDTNGKDLMGTSTALPLDLLISMR